MTMQCKLTWYSEDIILKARKAVQRAISKWDRNGGCLALKKCAEQLDVALARLEDNAPDESQ